MGNSNFFSAHLAGTFFPYERSSHFLVGIDEGHLPMKPGLILNSRSAMWR